MRVDIVWQRERDVAIASVLGRLNNISSDKFLAMVEEGIALGDRALLLDFARVTYISSAGLRACLVLAKQCSGQGRRLGLCSLSRHNRDVVAVSGFDQLVLVYDTRENAVAELQST